MRNRQVIEAEVLVRDGVSYTIVCDENTPNSWVISQAIREYMREYSDDPSIIGLFNATQQCDMDLSDDVIDCMKPGDILQCRCYTRPSTKDTQKTPTIQPKKMEPPPEPPGPPKDAKPKKARKAKPKKELTATEKKKMKDEFERTIVDSGALGGDAKGGGAAEEEVAMTPMQRKWAEKRRQRDEQQAREEGSGDGAQAAGAAGAAGGAGGAGGSAKVQRKRKACAKGHPLEDLGLPGDKVPNGMSCKVCDETITAPCHVVACMACQYAACDKCAQAGVGAGGNGAGAGGASSAEESGQPVRPTEPRTACAKGHPLEDLGLPGDKVPNGMSCKVCNETITAPCHVVACMACQYAACDKCAQADQRVLPTGQPAAQPVQPSVSTQPPVLPEETGGGGGGGGGWR